MNKRDEIYHAVISEIERVGGTIDEERQGVGSHRLIYWSFNGQKFRNTVQAYSGNWRTHRNAIADIRAKIRGTRQ